MYGFAEPDTGGELFMPRNGDPGRNRALATVAAQMLRFHCPLERISRRPDAWLRRKQLEINRRARIGPCDAH